jgi:two-component system, chemotaxis family, CheB/CheR fusion protein
MSWQEWGMRAPPCGAAANVSAPGFPGAGIDGATEAMGYNNTGIEKPMATKKIKRSHSHSRETPPAPDRAPAHAAETPQSTDELCPVAGFGASAGGLEAFSELLQSLPADTGVAFVLIQHLDPKHSSLLTELLSRSTPMPVVEVKDGMRTESNHVYVIPPNANMTISNGALRLEPRAQSHMPIDYFFRSLAQDQGSKAVGVILSGTASDGTLGLKAIKAEGGITFAQEESTAKYDGMPRSAILSGCVDFILPPEGIAREIVRLCRHPYVAPSPDNDVLADEDERPFSQIFAMLRNTTGVDFHYYKHATIRRRILRRMALQKLERVDQYTDFLRKNPREITALFQDILINVTSFFREASTFQQLKAKVYPVLFKDRVPEDPVRIWTPGCATGEEAYSVAISVIEYMRENNLDIGAQVFGTDLSETSLEKARAGVYPETLSADVSGERLRRFFVRVNGNYQISRSIRDMCVFARQNLTNDPPFSRLDLISCRNVLIYLGPVLQTKVLRYFHYGLKPNGFLVLGLSESVGSMNDLFVPLDGKEKIYTKRTPSMPVNLDFGGFEEIRAGAELKRIEDWTTGTELLRRVDQLVLARHSPPGVVVDADLKILQFRGHTAAFLEHTGGQPSLNLLKMTRGGAGLELRKLIQKVKKTGATMLSDPVRLALNNEAPPVRLAVTPVKGMHPDEMVFLILFEPKAVTGKPRQITGKPGRTRTDTTRIDELESELGATKQYLQTVIEEQEAASEELKSAHEEVQSSNEELQSTNEELLTSKEELQSTNEELNTVNEEMQGRNAELTQINNDLNNLLSSVNIPIVMLGNDLRIRRFTPQAEKVLNLLHTDVGRKITDFRVKINVPDLENLFIDVIDNLHIKEREVQDQEGRTYLMSIRPYRTVENRIDGAVMTLYDVTERKQSAEIRYRRIFEAARDGILLAEGGTGEILDVNPLVSKLFGYPRNELIGKHLNETPLFQNTGFSLALLPRWQDGDSVQKRLALRGRGGESIEVEVIANAYMEGPKQVVQLNIRDVSARLRAEDDSRRDEEQRGQAEKMEAVGRLAGGVAHDFNNLLTAIVGYGDLLKSRIGSDASLVRDIDMIIKAGERATNVTRQLLAFGRKQILQPTVLDLNSVLADLAQMLRVMIGDKTDLVVRPAGSLARVKVDRGQIEQVITNLVLNARDAMPEGGRITIETANIHADENYLQTHRPVPPGEYVLLSVSDTGTGMDPETQAHLFEPFFTTKPKGIGTGLGLSTTYGFVKQSGGHVWAYSELGRGTTFHIYLPPAPEEEGAAAPTAASQEAIPKGSETILLVEDEPMVRRLSQEILEQAGYRVLPVANGPEALQVLKSFKDPVHLLLTDVILPQMSGRELADRVAQQRPEARVLFMTGHTEDAIVHHGVLEPGVALLQKPFTPPMLARKVRSVLDTQKPEKQPQPR